MKKIFPVNIFTKPVIVWITPFIIFSLLSVILYIKGIHLSGDEPHYLMVTQSLVDDGDFNLKNNVEDKTYMNFIPVELRPHMIIKNGKHLSYHMPGMSFLMAPFYLIYKHIPVKIPPQLFFRISASFINAFFAFVFFYLLRFLFPQKKTEHFWFLSLLLFPFLFHSVHLFPELPTATLLVGSFLLIFSKNEAPLTGGMLFSLAIWFHVKYYPALLIFAFFVMLKYLKEKNITKFIRFLAFPIISSLLLIFYCKFLYNTFNPTNIFPPENYFSAPVILKIKVFLSYLFDQRDGLLIYTPLLFLFFFGFRSKLRNKTMFLSILSVYVIFHSITTVRGAYSPAGRPVIFISWIILVFTANYYFSSKNKMPFKLLAGFSIFFSALLITHPYQIYQPVYASTSFRWSGLLRYLGSNMADIPRLFPSFLTHPVSFYIPNLIWIITLCVAIIFFYFRPGFKILKLNQLKIFFLFLIFIYFLTFFPHIYLVKSGFYLKNGVRFFNNSHNFVYLKNIDRFRIKTNQEYNIYFDKKSKNNRFKLLFESPEEIKISLKNGKKNIFIRKNSEKIEYNINLNKLNSFRFDNKMLIHIGVKLKSRQNSIFSFLKIVNFK